MRSLLAASLLLATLTPAFADDFAIGLPDTRQYGMSNFYISTPDGLSEREVVLLAYLSPLGSQLKSRAPTPIEMERIRSACRYMVSLFKASDAGEPDDYFIEFADGPAPLETIHPDRRMVFGFEAETGCEVVPQIIQVS